MTALRLAPNDPLDITPLQSMLEASPDLWLVWPLARIPFDRAQWFEALDTARGHRSFWIIKAGELIGHAGLRISERDGERRASFIFIKTEHRGHGVGVWLMAALEVEASRLGATSLGLTVRDYNARALRLYTRVGYQERSRTGTAIDMTKPI